VQTVVKGCQPLLAVQNSSDSLIVRRGQFRAVGGITLMVIEHEVAELELVAGGRLNLSEQKNSERVTFA